MTEQRNEAQSGAALAGEILDIAVGELLVSFRFLDLALFRLKRRPGSTETYATDGEALAYNIRHVLTSCHEERERPARDLLHILFHCLFVQPFRGGEVDAFCYNLACDIAVENLINELDSEILICKRSYRQDKVIEALKRRLGILSAEKIYHCLRDGFFSVTEMEAMAEDFYADDHGGWYQRDGAAAAQACEFTQGRRFRLQDREGLKKSWLAAARTLALDLDSFSKDRGDIGNELKQLLGILLQEKADYRRFLRRFTAEDEALTVNDEEFDCIYYTYGLNYYGNLPLIEPLEYKEERRIRELVIAIDTSASVAGKTVQAFLQKTYDILNEEKAFFDRFQLHILQCDTEIRQAAVITSAPEFFAYLDHLELSGFGGTDFRPVFEYVAARQREHQLTELKGLLYFTDGYGVFPAAKPPYETAFLFTEGDNAVYDVPSWAMKVILTEDEIFTV